MRFLFNIFVVIGIVSLFISCRKDDDDPVSIFQPTITDIIPQSGPVNTRVMIIGSKFAAEADVNIVRHGSRNMIVDRVVPDTIWARVPAGAVTAPITVRVRDLSDTEIASSPVEFEVLAPSITSFEPGQVIQGDTLTIRGNYFNPRSNDFAFTLNDKNLGQIISENDSVVELIVARKLLSGKIKLTTFGQEVFSEQDLIILPRITSINPVTAPEGINVTIRGSGFSPSPQVSIDNTNATVSSSNDSVISVVVPAILSGSETSKQVQTIVRVNGFSSAPRNMTVVTSDAPVVFDINPKLASSGELMTITGSNFGTASSEVTVEFTVRNGMRVEAPITSITNTEIQVNIPAEAITGNLYITRNGIEAEAGPLTLPITYNRIQPFNIWEGTIITVTGENFPENASDILVSFSLNENLGGGTIEVTALSVSPDLTQITARVPQGTRNNQPIAIIVNEFRFEESELTMRILRPSIDALLPNTAPEGAIITIDGFGFSNVPAENFIYFQGASGNRIRATVVEAKFGELKVEVPNGVADGEIEYKVLNGIEQTGPFFALGESLPVFYLSSNSFQNAGIFRLTFTQGQSGVTGNLEEVLDLSSALGVSLDQTTGKIYAINNTEIWQANLTTGSLNWSEIYSGEAAANQMKSIAVNSPELYLASSRDNIQNDGSNGIIFTLPGSGSGSADRLYSKDNGFFLTSASHTPRIAFSGSNGMIWATQETNSTILNVSEPFNIMAGNTSGANPTVVYDATEMLTAAGYANGTFPLDGSSTITDLEVDNNDLYVCLGTPIDLGSNSFAYPRVFKGNITGTANLTLISNGFIGERDIIRSITLSDDFIYGVISKLSGQVRIFKMRKDGSQYEDLFTLPGNVAFGNIYQLELVK